MIVLTLVSGSIHGEPFSDQDAVNEDLGSSNRSDGLKGKASTNLSSMKDRIYISFRKE